MPPLSKSSILAKPSVSVSSVLLAKTIDHLKSDGFETALADWLRDVVTYDNIIMLSYYQERAPSLLFSLVEEEPVFEKYETIYTKGAYLLDPFHTLHLEQSPEGIYRLEDIAPDQFKRNRYFKEYYQNTTMIDEFAYIAYPVDGISVHISLGRDITSSQRFSARQVSAAKSVAPIVCALIKNHWNNLNSHEVFEESRTFQNLTDKIKQKHQISLSPRQAQVAVLILKGHSSMSIGLQLGISTQTVKVFRKQLYKKCQISSQAELFSFLMPVLTSSQ